MALGFSTMEERYLVYVYMGVWVIQGGYLAWVVREWFRARKRG